MMYLNSKFTFGKYEGLTLKEVYQGTLNPDKNVIQAFLNKILNTRYKALETCKLTDKFLFIDKFTVVNNFIYVDGGLDPYSLDEGIAESIEVPIIENEIKNYINTFFQPSWLGVLENLQDFNSKQIEKKNIGADPTYIEWCIKEVNSFIIHYSTMKELEKLSIAEIKGIEILWIDDNIYEYAPLIETRKFKFKEQLIDEVESMYKIDI
jgi:hypothetical protein